MGIGWAGDLFAPARTPSSLSGGQGAPNWAQRAGKWLVDDAEYGRKKLAAELAPYKEDHAMTTAGGEMLGNALATLPVGGVLGKAVQVGGNAFKAGKFVSPLAEALSSGGMRASGLSTIPGMAVRATGGAISGGASSWLVDPESGVSGALFGAALPVAAPAAALAARVLPKHVLGMTTGTSAETIGAAFNAGKNKAEYFLDSMRGVAPINEAVNNAKNGVMNLQNIREKLYRNGGYDISPDKSVLNFGAIDDALEKTFSEINYKGASLGENSEKTFGKLKEAASQWRHSDPNSFHTPEGIDALMRKIKDIQHTQSGESVHDVAGSFYNKVKNVLEEQAPVYSSLMRDFDRVIEKTNDIAKLRSSGGNKAEVTKELQALLKKNVPMERGNTVSAAQLLNSNEKRDLVSAIAGQGLSSWGLKGKTPSVLEVAGVNLPALLGNALTVGATSPRLVGELAYGAGRGAKVFNGLLTQPENRQVVADWFFRPLPSLLANNPLHER